MPGFPPAADHDHYGAVLAYNASPTTAIEANRIVAMSAYTNGRLTVEPAGPTEAGKYPLLLTKHKIPPGEYGICVPWVALSDFAVLDSLSAAGQDDEITAQPAAGSVLTVVSGNAGDTSVAITIYGLGDNGQAITEVITTHAANGTTAVNGVKVFTAVHLVLKAVTLGTITVSDDDPATIVTLLLGAISAGRAVGPTDQSAGTVSFVADAATTAKILLVGTDTAGAAQIEVITLAGTTTVESALTWGTWTHYGFGAVAAARTITMSANVYADNQDELYVAAGGRVTSLALDNGTDIPVGVCVVDDSGDTATGAVLFPGFNAVGLALARNFASFAGTAGAGLVGILDTLATITATTVEAALAELSNRVRTQLVTCTLAASAEAANVITVTVNVVDLNGTAVSRAQRVKLQLYEITMIAALVGAARLAETGAGSEITTTANAALIILTDANGDATVTVTDVMGASSKTFVLEATPIGVSGTYTHGTPTYVALTFDGV